MEHPAKDITDKICTKLRNQGLIEKNYKHHSKQNQNCDWVSLLLELSTRLVKFKFSMKPIKK